MKTPIIQIKIIQFLLRNGNYTGSFRDFAKIITGNADNASNIRRTLQLLTEAGVVEIESNSKINQYSEKKTIIAIKKDWLEGVKI